MAGGGMGGVGGEQTAGTGGEGGEGANCGSLGNACCATSCEADLVCLNEVSCSCVKDLFGSYVLRSDGRLLKVEPGTNGAQTPVLNAGTGLALTDVVHAHDGISHGCAVLSNGTVSCWRTASQGNERGQLGNGATDTSGATFRATAVLTAANTPLTNVKAMAAGNEYSPCAVTTDGKLYCWGDLEWVVNNGVRLHSGYAQAITTDGATLLTGVVQASTGYHHACAVVEGTSGNEVWCWGLNRNTLGLGDTVNRQYPTRVLGLTNPTKVLVEQWSSNYNSATCALDGSNVRCWGANGGGQAGIGNTSTPVGSPQLVTVQSGAALTGVLELYHGGSGFCALRTGATMWCWGGGFQNYAGNYGVTNVFTVGWTGSPIRFLTTDGMYHIGTTNRAPNCGDL